MLMGEKHTAVLIESRSPPALSPGAKYLDANLLCRIPRVIFWIHVDQFPRADAVQLEDGFFIGPGVVAHGRGHYGEGAGGHRLFVVLFELFTGANVEAAGDDRHVFVGGVPVGHDLVVGGEF